jgi:hypothetical protein
MQIHIHVSVAENSTNDKSNLVYVIANSLKPFFSSQSYGDDILQVSIGFIMVTHKPGFEEWYKEKQPRYTEFKSSKSKLTGEIIEVSKRFSYQIKLSDIQLNKLINGSEKESLKLIAIEIINSLNKLDKIPKKVKSFDKSRFKSDLETQLKNDFIN